MNKNFLMIGLTIIVLSSSLFAANSTPKVCIDISGEYSIKQMTCSGEWSHPFLVVNDKLFDGYFLNEEVINIVQRDCDNLKIKLENRSRGYSREFRLPEYSDKKKVRIQFNEDSIKMHQYKFIESEWDYGMYLGSDVNQRFTALLKKDWNNNLILINKYAWGTRGQRIYQECYLPHL